MTGLTSDLFQVESPSLVWVQLTSDPGADVVRLSEVMADLKPLRLTQVKGWLRHRERGRFSCRSVRGVCAV